MPVVGLYIHPWHTYGQDILRGVSRFIADRPDWECYLPWPGAVDQQAKLPNRRLDGLILRVGGEYDVPAGFGTGHRRVVIANTDRTADTIDIAWDNHAIGRLAGQHLLEQGHRTIVFFGQPERHAYQRHRCEGLIASLADRQIDFRSVNQDQTHREELLRLLRDLPRPAAVFAATDPLGMEALHAAREIGRRIPEDLAVVSAGDNDVFCELSSPPLSSVALPGEEVGYQAAARLDQLLVSGIRPAPLVVPPRYVSVRRSSDMLAIDDDVIATAVRFIRQNATDGLTVDELRRRVPLSRRALEIRFKRVLGRTIEEEIRRVRVDKAKRLLLDTTLSMADVATRSGFASAQRLSAVFSAEVREPPSGYRRRFLGLGSADRH